MPRVWLTVAIEATFLSNVMQMRCWLSSLIKRFDGMLLTCWASIACSMLNQHRLSRISNNRIATRTGFPFLETIGSKENYRILSRRSSSFGNHKRERRKRRKTKTKTTESITTAILLIINRKTTSHRHTTQYDAHCNSSKKKWIRKNRFVSQFFKLRFSARVVVVVFSVDFMPFEESSIIFLCGGALRRASRGDAKQTNWKIMITKTAHTYRRSICRIHFDDDDEVDDAKSHRTLSRCFSHVLWHCC